MNYSYYEQLVRARLSDDGSAKARTKDEFGNDVLVDTKIYSDEQISSYLEGSVRRFNLLFNKNLNLDDIETSKFADLIVQGAVVTGLASKALVESGRNFSYVDAGVEYNSPNVASVLMQQWQFESVDYRNKVEFLLTNLRLAA